MFYRPDLTQFGCIWRLTPKCNYRCPYCFDQEKAQPQIPYRLEECLPVFDRLARRYGRMQVGFTGGEPTLHPLFFPLVKHLSAAGQVLFVSTNLSRRPDLFLKNMAQPDLCYINASFHPNQTEVLPFYARVAALHEAGFHISCSCVLFPPHLSVGLAAQKFFARHLPEVYFGFSVFFGDYAGRRYPESYSAEEREIIETECGLDLEARIMQTVRRGSRLCRAGQDFFVIAAEGRIVRCVSEAPLFHESFPDFSLSDQPFPCPLAQCLCPDMHEFWIP
jgi:pyruvate-formate lyase-activating enzyme